MTKNKDVKPKKLTLKQRKWLQLYISTGNATQAAIEAYGLDPKKQRDTASQIGWENMRKLEFSIEELMDEGGITDVYLLRKLNENLDATKLFGKNAIEHQDFPSRNKALEIALKMKGKLTDKLDVTSQGKQVAGFIYNAPKEEKKEGESNDGNKNLPRT